jgi:hypothetical protein
MIGLFQGMAATINQKKGGAPSCQWGALYQNEGLSHAIPLSAMPETSLEKILCG